MTSLPTYLPTYLPTCLLSNPYIRSTGRKVKRIIWKMGLYQCISGFWLLVIATNASYSNALVCASSPS